MRTIFSGCVATLVLSFDSTSLAGPACAGRYPSWGRACYGSVEITARSIEWRAQFSNCTASPYEVIASDLEGEKPFVAYRFKKRSKACLYEVVEIAKQGGDHWAAIGYRSVEDYNQRQDDPGSSDYCPLGPMPSQSCNLPLVHDRK